MNFTERLSRIIQYKKTRLCLSLDVTSASEFLLLADQLGPYISMLKTHIDIISDFSWDLIFELKKLSKKHDFLIFEDRKFADIGSTVKHQCADGIYQITQWADLINAHILPGEGIISGLKEACKDSLTGLLLIAQMSSAGNFIDQKYTDACIELAEKHSDFVLGFIAQKRLINNFWHLTPGVNLDVSAGKLGQQYRTPEQALHRDGCDLIIVGSGIYQAKDPIASAMEYQRRSFA